MSQVRGRMLFAMLAVAGMAATGCGSTSDQMDNVAATATPGMTSPGGTEAPGMVGPTGVEAIQRVGAVALGAVPDSKIVSMKSENDGKKWEVVTASKDGEKHQMTIDPQSRKVTKGPEAEKSSSQEKSQTQQLLKAAKVDYKEAADKMLGAFPGSSLKKLKLTKGDSRTVWKGTVEDADKTEHKVLVNAATGALIGGPGGTMSPGESPTGTMMPSPTQS